MEGSWGPLPKGIGGQALGNYFTQPKCKAIDVVNKSDSSWVCRVWGGTLRAGREMGNKGTGRGTGEREQGQGRERDQGRQGDTALHPPQHPSTFLVPIFSS